MKDILTKLINHEDLTREEAKNILINITKNTYNDDQISALLAVIQANGVTVNELIGFQEGLLESRVAIDLSVYQPIDIVGTGGDGKNTFNISTCSCFVVAGAGYNVAKHGNYGATSVSGASNVMEQHGVKFSNDQAQINRSMEGCGMVYLHAPLFTPAMKFVAPVRKSLQVRTVFNLLGPLVNPCRPSHQLLGVADLKQMRLYANVYRELGIRFGIVNSLDGYDEISLTGDFKISTNEYDRIFTPKDLNLSFSRPDELHGGTTIEDAAKIFDNVLTNKASKAQKECVLANAAFAIQIIEPDKNIQECLAIATESLESGNAYNTLKKFVEING